MTQSNNGRSSQVKLFAGLAMLIAAIGIGGYLWPTENQSQKSRGPAEKVSIAFSNSPTAALIFIASAKGFFAKEGLDVLLQPHTSGKSARKSMLEGNADLATMGDIPIMFAAMQGKKIVVLATTSSSEKVLSVVARKDKGIAKPLDLVGKKIGVTLGTSGEFFMDVLLNANGVKRNNVEVVNLASKKIVDAILKGNVDAISTWQPHGIRSKEALGKKAVIFSGAGIHRETINLVGKSEFVRKRPEPTKRLLRGLIQSEKFMRKNLDESIKIVGERLEMDGVLLRRIWNFNNFEVSLRQSLLLTLEDESRWAIKNKLVDEKNVPNYLKYIYQDGLRAVKPDAVSVIY